MGGLEQYARSDSILSGMGVHPSDQNIIYGGNQDNGTPKYSGTLDWNDMGVCGDGGYFAIDPNVPSTVYASCQRYSINRSLKNGDVISGFPSFSDITMELIKLTGGNSFHLLSSTHHYRTGSISALAASWQTMDRGDTWTAISADLSAGNVGDCSVAGPGTSVRSMCFTTTATSSLPPTTNGRVWRTLNAGLGASATWSDITGTGLSTRFITSIKTKRGDSTGNILYATFFGLLRQQREFCG